MSTAFVSSICLVGVVLFLLLSNMQKQQGTDMAVFVTQFAVWNIWVVPVAGYWPFWLLFSVVLLGYLSLIDLFIWVRRIAMTWVWLWLLMVLTPPLRQMT